MDDKVSIGKYTVMNDIGNGAFGNVKLAIDTETNKYVAVKVIPRKMLLQEEVRAKFESEIRILQQLHHPGIVELLDILKDDTKDYVFMEFCSGGELFDYIVKQKRVSESDTKSIIIQICTALKFMHSLGIGHRDLKPENILFDEHNRVKISDFGFAKFITENTRATTPCGSPCYVAPEIISRLPYDPRVSDMWALGVICYAMVTGKLPWTQREQTYLFNQIRSGDFTIPSFLSPSCRDFISCLMETDPSKRLTANQALSHPWLSDSTDSECADAGAIGPASVSLKALDAFFERDDSDLNVPESVINRCVSDTVLATAEVMRKITKKHAPVPPPVQLRGVLAPRKHTIKKPLMPGKSYPISPRRRMFR